MSNYPLSYPQSQIWKACKVTKNLPMWHIHDTILLEGPLDIDSLKQAVIIVMQLNSSLRTKLLFIGNNTLQAISDCQSIEQCFIEIDHSNLEDFESHSQAKICVQKFIDEALDLQNGSLFKVLLIKLKENQHVLSIKSHHIAADNFSLSIIWRDLSQAYNSFILKKNLQHHIHKQRQYFEYVKEQLELESEHLREDNLQYWREELPDMLPFINLPTDFPRIGSSSYYCYYYYEQNVMPVDLYRNISQSIIFPILVSALFILLYKYTRQEQILIGTYFSTRQRIDDGTVGSFSNIVPLYMDLDENISISKLIKMVKWKLVKVRKHQQYSLDVLCERVKNDYSRSDNNLFQVVINKLITGKQGWLSGDNNIASEFYQLHQKKWFPFETNARPMEMGFTFYEDDGSINLVTNYRACHYKRQTIQTMISDYKSILALCVKEYSHKQSNRYPNLFQNESTIGAMS